MDFLATDQEGLKKIREAMADLPPFTILITNADDVVAIVSALTLLGCNGNADMANTVGVQLGLLCEQHGVEKGVNIWVDSGISKGVYLPKWLKPMLIHYHNHIASK